MKSKIIKRKLINTHFNKKQTLNKNIRDSTSVYEVYILVWHWPYRIQWTNGKELLLPCGETGRYLPRSLLIRFSCVLTTINYRNTFIFSCYPILRSSCMEEKLWSLPLVHRWKSQFPWELTSTHIKVTCFTTKQLLLLLPITSVLSQ